jgi:2-octaprenyl-6-methoxyphenol hydroxylase
MDMSVATRPERYDLIISGASFAGLALARAVRAAFGGETRIAVIDRAVRHDGLETDVRAFALSAASRRMLDALGIWERLRRDAQDVSEIEITDSSLEAGVRPVLLKYDNHVGASEPATFIVPGAALYRALSESTAGDVTLIAPAQADGLTSGDVEAEVVLADGRRLTAALVVAADGRRSALREAAKIKVVAWSYRQTGIVTTIAHGRAHGGRAVQHFLPGGPFAILPLRGPDGRGDRSCITWSEEAGEAARILGLDDADFLAEVEKRVGGRLGALKLAGPRQSWPLEMHLARSYVAPRFALIGDAAHGVHPIAGQGLNLALRDVAALTEVLIDAARLGLDLGNIESLRRYERWRRFDSTLSAVTFDGLNRMFSNDWTLVRAARDFGLGLVDRMPGLKALFVEEAAGLSGDLPRLLKGEAI